VKVPLAVTLLLVFLSPEIVHAQGVAPTPQSFQVDWQPRGGHMMPGIDGYVYNSSEYRVGNVRLKVDVLDASENVVGEQFTWVYGAIDAGGRGYFRLKLPAPGETYRIHVESFDLLSRQTLPQAP
jgi:hypothetical protein